VQQSESQIRFHIFMCVCVCVCVCACVCLLAVHRAADDSPAWPACRYRRSPWWQQTKRQDYTWSNKRPSLRLCGIQTWSSTCEITHLCNRWQVYQSEFLHTYQRLRSNVPGTSTLSRAWVGPRVLPHVHHYNASVRLPYVIIAAQTTSFFYSNTCTCASTL
jgi:hypothetical protein